MAFDSEADSRGVLGNPNGLRSAECPNSVSVRLLVCGLESLLVAYSAPGMSVGGSVVVVVVVVVDVVVVVVVFGVVVVVVVVFGVVVVVAFEVVVVVAFEVVVVESVVVAFEVVVVVESFDAFGLVDGLLGVYFLIDDVVGCLSSGCLHTLWVR